MGKRGGAEGRRGLLAAIRVRLPLDVARDGAFADFSALRRERAGLMMLE